MLNIKGLQLDAIAAIKGLDDMQMSIISMYALLGTIEGYHADLYIN